MPYTITFNDSTGSDSAASGTGGSALSGTGASYSGSVFTLDGSPDLSGVDTSTDLIWVGTSTGRQWFTIASVDDGADTVTVDDAPAGTTTGLSWGLGGTRNNLAASDQLFTDWKGGWTVELEDDQTISSSIDVTADGDTGGPCVIRSDTPGTPRAITITANDAVFEVVNSINFNLVDIGPIGCSNGTKTAAIGINCGSGDQVVQCLRCEIGDSTNTLLNGINRSANGLTFRLVGTTIHHCTAAGIDKGGGSSDDMNVLAGCGIFSNGAEGVLLDGGTANVIIAHTTIARNTGIGLDKAVNGTLSVLNCTIEGNGGDGIEITADIPNSMFVNNIFDSNGAYGLDLNGSVTQAIEEFNQFRNNTSGAINGRSSIAATSVTTDPGFGNAAGLNWEIGTALRAAGIPSSFLGSATDVFIDLGGVQREEAGGGGGDPFPSQGIQHIGSGVIA